MSLYSCKIPLCPLSKAQTTERSAIFRHYVTHLRDEIEETAINYGLPIFGENKYSLINSLIPFSKVEVFQK